MKKIIVFLVVVLMMQTTGFAEKVGFEALIYPKEEVSAPSEWAEESVKNAEKFEITDENKEYDYTSSISREEFCNLVYNTIKAVTKTDRINGNIILGDKILTDFTEKSNVIINFIIIVAGAHIAYPLKQSERVEPKTDAKIAKGKGKSDAERYIILSPR